MRDINDLLDRSAPLATGLSIIDDEHAALMNLHLRLMRCCDVNEHTSSHCMPEDVQSYEAELFDIYAELVLLMSTHFMHEESLMSRCPREWVYQHKYEHAEIASKVSSVLNRSGDSRDLVEPRVIFDLIFTWLDEHIKLWDVPLARMVLGEA